MSKTFKFVAVAALALALVVGTKASAAYMHMGTLKMGMTSENVKSLQQTLNMNGYVVSAIAGTSGSSGYESMYFGTKTKAAVMAFQAAKGLGADGVVGSRTGAALAALGGGSMPGSYPAGCTSNSGYSTTTGMPCTGGSMVPGCSSTSGYSSTTGQACNGSSNGGALNGTAGDITVTSYSSGLETNVGEGDTNTKVLGFEIEADAGSDVSISSVKLNFQNTGSGSQRLTRYADTVSVWSEDGTKIGSSDTDDFSESANVYSRSISLSNVVVRADKKMRFFVAVDAADNIDSADYSADSWTATLDSVRFSDASGAILTEDTNITKTFNFTSLASANDLELKVNLASSNLKAQTVKVSTTTNTNNIELVKFTMKAQGGKMNIDQIPVLFTTSDNDLDDVTGNVTLTIDGQSFSESVSTSSSAASTITFDDLDLDLDADETVTGTITADINSTSAYSEGTTLYASIPSSYVTATAGTLSIDVEDVNGDQLVTGDRTGSATGEIMTFRSTGVNTVMGTPSYNRTTDTSGNVTSVTYTIPVSVTSFGNTLYVGQSAQLATSASGSNAFALAFQTSAAPTTDEVISSASIAVSSSNATIESNGFRVDDGSTKNFTITVTLNTPATTAANYRVQLKQIQTFTNAALYSGASSSSLLPVEQFRTDYQFINS
jgi:peptidoglycan hydrolase-like protein with peptidoglycan-binding domain